MKEGSQVTSQIGAVAAGPPGAARIGAQIMAAGGNAFDAAAATCLGCCVLQPFSTGVGGYGGCAVVKEGKTGRVWSLDFNSRAPGAAREDMFEVELLPGIGEGRNEQEYLCKVKDDANIHGPLAAGVPGMMAGIGMLWERWGVLHWPEIVAPSLQLIEDGFPFARIAGMVKRLEKVIRRYEPTCRHLMPEGRLPKPEDLWRPRDLGATLAQLSSGGWREFYQGEVAARIADYVQSAGGILSREDLASYEPRVGEAPVTTYRGASAYTAELPNGGLSALQALNLMEKLPPAEDASVRDWHLLAEALKLMWRDRLRYLGDPEYVEVPVDRLLSKEYAAAILEPVLGDPTRVDTWMPHVGDPDRSTLHISTADRLGNVVSVTITHGMGFGSCVTVPDTGIILGHGMWRLDPRPGQANSIAPGKRPLNNMAPLLLELPDRTVALGLPGGRRIISVAPQMARRFVDQGATSHEVAVAGRLHVEVSEPVEVSDTVSKEVVAGLLDMGHTVKVVHSVGSAAHNAEYFAGDRTVRAGGGTWSACPE